MLTLRGHSKAINGMCFSRNGKRLATASSDFTAIIWDTDSGHKLFTVEGTRSVCFTPDGRKLATACRTETRIWDAENGSELLTLDREVSAISMCFSLDGKRLVTGDYNGTAKIWDTATGRELLTLNAHTGPVYGVCFSPNGNQLATASHDRTVKIWEATFPPEPSRKGDTPASKTKQ